MRIYWPTTSERRDEAKQAIDSKVCSRVAHGVFAVWMSELFLVTYQNHMAKTPCASRLGATVVRFNDPRAAVPLPSLSRPVA